MDKYYSILVESETGNNTFEGSFEATSGSVEINVNDELINNFNIAKERAKSIFMQQTYISKRAQFTTYHLDDIELGMIIKHDNIDYKIIEITENIKGAKASMSLICERWE